MNNPHKNARTTPYIRALIVERVLIQKRSVAAVAKELGISSRTVSKWLSRYKEQGEQGLNSRSSRPHKSPGRLPDKLIEIIKDLRLKFRFSPQKIADSLKLAYSTVTATLRKLRLNRARDLEPKPKIIRYEYPHPGDMLHLDIKKLPRFKRPGHRVTGNRAVNSNGCGREAVHVCVDDHSRWAYVEVLEDEKKGTTTGFLERALKAYEDLGLTIKRVMTDNGPAYCSNPFNELLKTKGIKHIYTRPYTPRTNGKAERFIRTMLNEWAYAKPYPDHQSRHAALSAWINKYNLRREHGSIGKKPPVSRIPSLCEQGL